MATVKQVEADLTVVKGEVNQIGSLLVKLETTLDKITDVCNNCTQILAVHEQRLLDGDNQFNEMKRDIREIEETVDSDIKELHSRVTTQHRELEEKMSKEIDKVLEAIQDLKGHMLNKHDDIEARIANLERWRWIIVGGAIAGAFILGNSEIIRFFS